MKKIITLLMFFTFNSHAADIEKYVDFYGSLRVASIVSDGSASLGDKSSRVGFKVSKEFLNDWFLGGRGEYAVRITRNTKNFAFQGDEFKSSSDTGDVFSNRLGYLEAKHEKYGTIRAGKQWSVYYDTTKLTDTFRLFGGEASGTYSFFSDGGFLGTGRADNALTYRNAFDSFSFGLQYVFTDDKEINITDKDSSAVVSTVTYERAYGLSLTQKLFDDKLTLSSAYNRSEFVFNNKNFDSYSWASAIALKFDKTELRYTYFQGKDTEQTNSGTLIDPRGHESIIRQGIGDRYRAYIGFNLLEPKDSDNDYKLEKYIVGVDYSADFLVLAAEFKQDESTNENGADRDESTFGLLVRLDF